MVDAIDTHMEIDRIVKTIDRQVHATLHKRGAIVAVSGGIDSSVCAALCTRALGTDHVLALSLPERHSSTTASTLAQELCTTLDITLVTVAIDSILNAAGCYESQDAAMRQVFPEYQHGDAFKIVLPSLLAGDRLNVPRVTWVPSDGTERTARIPSSAYLLLVAATNFKQRMRTMTAYFHADRLNRAVCGTPNRLEYDQGFFVKGGDGLSDFAPIAHLYKSHVYAIGRALGLPRNILEREPTTDTFPLEQTQEEFYFSAPYAILDACLYGMNHGQPSEDIAAITGLPPDRITRLLRDIEAKRRSTQHLHLRTLTVEPIEPVEAQILLAIRESRL